MTKSKAKAIVTLEKLRLIESELFRVASKYGVSTIDELDKLLEIGKISEKNLGEDYFLFDHLLNAKEKLEKELKKLSIKKSLVWKNLQSLLDLPKPNFRI